MKPDLKFGYSDFEEAKILADWIKKRLTMGFLTLGELEDGTDIPFVNIDGIDDSMRTTYGWEKGSDVFINQDLNSAMWVVQIPFPVKQRGESIKPQKEDIMVTHPPHYQSRNGMEVIDVIEAFTADLTGMEAVDTGNVLKYTCRWKHKNGLQDLKKAQWYLNHLIEHIENKYEKENE